VYYPKKKMLDKNEKCCIMVYNRQVVIRRILTERHTIAPIGVHPLYSITASMFIVMQRRILTRPRKFRAYGEIFQDAGIRKFHPEVTQMTPPDQLSAECVN
jgi:hypothetical protein